MLPICIELPLARKAGVIIQVNPSREQLGIEIGTSPSSGVCFDARAHSFGLSCGFFSSDLGYPPCPRARRRSILVRLEP